MAISFPSAVNAPGGLSYAAPLLSFQGLGEIGDSYNQGNLSRQQQEQNKIDIQRRQQQLDISKTFEGGLPRDPRTGQIDYSKAVAMLAQKGDISALWNGADAMAIQGAGSLSPMLSGGAQPAGQPQAQPQGQPASLPARPQPAPAANSPQGDAGSGTIASIVTDRMPQQDAATGQAIGKIAQLIGVDPNAPLTPGQLRRAQGLVQRYASAHGPGKTDAPDTTTGQGGGASFKDRFAAAGNGDLPPSANAGTPKPRAAQPQPAPIGAGAPPQGGPAPQQAPQAAPQPGSASQQPAQQGGPITPQVPLPKGFSDPQSAILALRAEAARLGANPRAKAQVDALNDWAGRIETSLAPVKIGPNETLVDPRNSKTLYQGPGAAAIANAGNAPTLDADAERYRQTGQLPPNMGRGMQGSAEAKQIRMRAAEMEIQNGGDPSAWPKKWQEFKAQGVGLSAGERVKANREENLNLILKAADAAIPAALEASRGLPRGNYVPLNKLIQRGEIMSSDPRLVEFGMANLQLAEHWARAMNPTGVMRESDRDKALSFLDTAYGNNTYERAVMQLQKQITRERDAVRGGGTILKDNKAPSPGEEGKSTDWVRGPDGKLGPSK